MPELEKQDLETMLREYIEEQRKADAAGTLHKIFNAFQDHEKKDEIRHVELEAALRGVSLRVGILEREHNDIERRVNDSGHFEIVESRASAKELRGRIWAAAGAIAMLILGAAVAWFTKGH